MGAGDHIVDFHASETDTIFAAHAAPMYGMCNYLFFDFKHSNGSSRESRKHGERTESIGDVVDAMRWLTKQQNEFAYCIKFNLMERFKMYLNLIAAEKWMLSNKKELDKNRNNTKKKKWPEVVGRPREAVRSAKSERQRTWRLVCSVHSVRALFNAFSELNGF